MIPITEELETNLTDEAPTHTTLGAAFCIKPTVSTASLLISSQFTSLEPASVISNNCGCNNKS